MCTRKRQRPQGGRNNEKKKKTIPLLLNWMWREWKMKWFYNEVYSLSLTISGIILCFVFTSDKLCHRGRERKRQFCGQREEEMMEQFSVEAESVDINFIPRSVLCFLYTRIQRQCTTRKCCLAVYANWFLIHSPRPSRLYNIPSVLSGPLSLLCQKNLRKSETISRVALRFPFFFCVWKNLSRLRLPVCAFCIRLHLKQVNYYCFQRFDFLLVERTENIVENETF